MAKHATKAKIGFKKYVKTGESRPKSAKDRLKVARLGLKSAKNGYKGRVYRYKGKPGTIWQFSVCHENRHFGGECSRILAGKARKCGNLWVFACVPNPGKQNIWRQCPPSARKQSAHKLPNRPVFTHLQGSHSTVKVLRIYT